MLCHRRHNYKKNNQKLLQSYGRKRHSQGKSYDKQIIKNQIEWRQKMIFILQSTYKEPNINYFLEYCNTIVVSFFAIGFTVTSILFSFLEIL